VPGRRGCASQQWAAQPRCVFVLRELGFIAARVGAAACYAARHTIRERNTVDDVVVVEFAEIVDVLSLNTEQA
jgi:hypothetical protein